MAFRIITKPLKRRTENVPINNELTIDEVQGNIGIQIQKDNTEGNSKKDYEYKSGSEEIKSEFQSLKIRSKIINDELKNINYGSINNVNDEGFNLNNALNENDICGAIEYVYNKYKEYIIEDENGNIKFNSEVTDHSKELQEIFNKLYNINGDSYSHKFRQILAEIFKSNKIINNYNQEKDSEISIYTKIRKDINNVYLPQLEEYEMQISKLESYCNTLDLLVNSNLVNTGEFFNSLENIKDDISNNEYEIKKRKFAYFNVINTDNSFNDLMTENEIKEPFNNSNNYIIKEYNGDLSSDPSFIENFLPSPLDINYDGNENLTYIDSFYEMRYKAGYNKEVLYDSFINTLQFNTENRDFVCLIGNNDLGLSASVESPDNYTNKLFNSIFSSFIVHDSKYNKLTFKDNQNKQVVKNALYISHKKNLRNIILKEFYNREDIKNLLNYKLQNDIKNVFSLLNNTENYFNEYSEFDYYVDFNDDDHIINKVLYQYKTDEGGRFKFLYNKLNQYHYNGYDKTDLTIKNPYYYGIIFRKYINDYNDLLNSIFNNLSKINTPTIFNSEYYYEFSENVTEVRKILFNFVDKKFNFILLDENNKEITEPLKMIIRNSTTTLLEKDVTRSKEFNISNYYFQDIFIEFYNKNNTKLFTIKLNYDNEYTFDKALNEFFDYNSVTPTITTTFNIVNKDISPVFYSSVKDYFKGV